MAVSSKNQTAIERARMRELHGAELSPHTCASPNCHDPEGLIAKRDLFPVVMMAPKRRTVFYHRQCSPTQGAMPSRAA